MYWTDYKLQVPKWILIKSTEISVKHCKMKVKVYDCCSHHHILTIPETHLVLHNTTFSLVCNMRLEWCTRYVMYCVPMSPHFSNKHLCRLFVPHVWQKLEMICQYQSHEVITIAVNHTVYDSQFVTMKILYCSDIHFMQKVLHLCVKHIKSLSHKAEGTIFMLWVSALMTHFVIVANLYTSVWWTVCWYQVDIVSNTRVIFLSQLPHYLYENICFSKSHLTHMWLMWHIFNGKTVINTIVQVD